MGNIKINLAGVGDFELIPNGHYPAVFESYKFGKTKEKGDDKVDVTFVLTDDADPYAGRKMWRVFTFGEKALWAFKNFLIVLGAPEDEINGEFDVAEMLDDYKGTVVMLQIEADSSYTPPGASEPKVRNKVADIKVAEAALLI